MVILNLYKSNECSKLEDPKELIIDLCANHKFKDMNYPIIMAYYNQTGSWDDIIYALKWGFSIYIIAIIIERISCQIIKPKRN